MYEKVSVKKITEALTVDYKLFGLTDVVVTHPASIESAGENSITFCNVRNETVITAISNTDAKVVLCHANSNITKQDAGDKTLILVANPRYAFIEVINKFFTPKKEHKIADTAVIHKKAMIHPSVSIGDFCYIGECSIGEGSVIYEDVQIYDKTQIGKNVIIHAGTTIGVPDAFSYERNSRGELIKFTHFGGVIIEDNVDLHQHVNIDRATFGNTIIGKGTKINRYTHVGHNSIIGRHCQIGGKCFLAGSCNLGDFCELAFCSSLRDGINLGHNVMVGMGSVVTKDIESNWLAYGVPAKKIREISPLSFPCP